MARSTVKASVVMMGVFVRIKAAAQQGAEAGEQLVESERFGDVVVGAGVQCLDLVVGTVPGGEDKDWHAAPLPQARDDRGSVDVRQAEVEDEDVDRVLGG